MSINESQRRSLVVIALPEFEPDIGRWIWALQDCRQRTRDALANVKPERLDLRSNTTGHSIGTLLYHIAAIEWDWLATDVMEKKWRDDPLWQVFPFDVRDADGRLTYVSGHPLEDYWQRLDLVRDRVVDVYQNMTIEEFRRVRQLPDYDVTPEWVLHHLCQHEALHRDELVALANMRF